LLHLKFNINPIIRNVIGVLERKGFHVSVGEGDLVTGPKLRGIEQSSAFNNDWCYDETLRKFHYKADIAFLSNRFFELESDSLGLD